jgi:hypothetical protein
MPGAAERNSSVETITLRIIWDETQGRAPSWIKTKSGASRSKNFNPLKTDSCRVAPPWTKNNLREKSSLLKIFDEKIASLKAPSSAEETVTT